MVPTNIDISRTISTQIKNKKKEEMGASAKLTLAVGSSQEDQLSPIPNSALFQIIL